MAETDNLNNSQSECLDRKRCREEENLETLASPEPDSTKKKKKKKRNKKNKEPDEQPQVQVCPNPLLGTAIPIIPQNETTETTAQNPDEKKHVQDAQQLQTCNPSITIGMEPDIRKEKETQLDDVNGNGNLYPKHEPAIPEMEKGAEPNEVILENPASDPTPSDDTPRKNKWKRKKKNVVEPQGAEPEPTESNNIEHPHQSSPVDSELMNKMKEETKLKEGNAGHSRVSPQLGLTPPLDIAVPKDSELEKREEPTETNIEYPIVCSKPKSAPLVDLATPMNPEKEKEVGLSVPHEQHSQPIACTKPDSQPPGDLTTPIDPIRGKRKSKKGKKRKMCLEEKAENQSDPAIPVCPNPESLTDKSIPIDPAILMDTEQEMEKKKRKKQRKNVLDGVEPNETVMEQAETPIQTPTCLIAAPPVDPTIPMDPRPATPISPAISTDPEQKISKKRRKKKRKSTLQIEGAEPNEHDGKPPDAPDQKFIYPVAAPSIDSIIPIDQASPVDIATPIDQGQKMTKKKRKKKNRIVLISEGADPNEHCAKLPETPVQGSIYPIAAPLTDTTSPTGPAPPVDTATPIGQGQEMTKKKRKKKRRSALTSERAEPNERECEPPETPVQRSIYPTSAPSIGPTIPTGQAPPTDPVTPVDPEQMMTKKKRKKKRRKSELKNEELESKKHNADPTAETPVQRTEGPSAVNVSTEWAGENSMSKCNAEPAATTQVLGSSSLIVSPKDESSLRCQACRHLGHNIRHCQKLKFLSMDEEVCFFCGEIGHSLGKCSVSQAGGGRFAKCLFCYEHGHFSYNCPHNGQGIVPKVCSQWPYRKNYFR